MTIKGTVGAKEKTTKGTRTTQAQESKGSGREPQIVGVAFQELGKKMRVRHGQDFSSATRQLQAGGAHESALVREEKMVTVLEHLSWPSW